MNYQTLKETGTLIVKNGASEFYAYGGKVYRARYQSLGGFTGTGGWRVKEVASIAGHQHSPKGEEVFAVR